jgi:hypothetical protein
MTRPPAGQSENGDKRRKQHDSPTVTTTVRREDFRHKWQFFRARGKDPIYKVFKAHRRREKERKRRERREWKKMAEAAAAIKAEEEDDDSWYMDTKTTLHNVCVVPLNQLSHFPCSHLLLFTLPS